MQYPTTQHFLSEIENRMESEKKYKEQIPENSIPTDYNMTDIDGNNLIHYAIKEGNLNFVRDLIENKHIALLRSELHPLVKINLPFGKEDDYYLPKEVILLAINSNQLDIAKFLIEHCQKKYGDEYIFNISFDKVQDKNNLALFLPFLEQKMQPYQSQGKIVAYDNLSKAAYDMGKVIELAASLNAETALNQLMSKECNYGFNTDTGQPIKKFDQWTGTQITQLFFDPFTQGIGRTIVFSSSNNYSDTCIKFLRNYIQPHLDDLSPNLKKNIDLALLLLIQNNTNPNLELVQELLSCRANINIVNSAESRTTLLMLAAKSGQLPLIEVLLKNGANPNALDIHGNTFLHFLTKEQIEKLTSLNIDKDMLARLAEKQNHYGEKPTQIQSTPSIGQTDLIKKTYYYHLKLNRSLDNYNVTGMCNGLSMRIQLDQSKNKENFYKELANIASWDGDTQFKRIILQNEYQPVPIDKQLDKTALYVKNNNGQLSLFWYEKNRKLRTKNLNQEESRELLALFNNENIIESSDQRFNRAMNINGNIQRPPEWDDFYNEVIFLHFRPDKVAKLFPVKDQANRAYQLHIIGNENNQIKKVSYFYNPNASIEHLISLCKLLLQLPNQVMVDLGGEKHACSIYKNDEGKLVYYDPNSEKKFPPTNNPEELAQIIQNELYIQLGKKTDPMFIIFNMHCLAKDYLTFLHDAKKLDSNLKNCTDIEKFRFFLLTERHEDAIKFYNNNNKIFDERDSLGLTGLHYCLLSNNKLLIEAVMKNRNIGNNSELTKIIDTAIFIDNNPVVLQSLNQKQFIDLLNITTFHLPSKTYDDVAPGAIEILGNQIRFILDHAKDLFAIGLLHNKSLLQDIFNSLDKGGANYDKIKEELREAIKSQQLKFTSQIYQQVYLTLTNSLPILTEIFGGNQTFVHGLIEKINPEMINGEELKDDFNKAIKFLYNIAQGHLDSNVDQAIFLSDISNKAATLLQTIPDDLLISKNINSSSIIYKTLSDNNITTTTTTIQNHLETLSNISNKEPIVNSNKPENNFVNDASIQLKNENVNVTPVRGFNSVI